VQALLVLITTCVDSLAITILRIDDMIKMQQNEKQGNAYEEALKSGSLNG